MRTLLLSDTHGDFAPMQAAIRDARADAVIHAGDFGFYDDDSAFRLSARELWLRVAHSSAAESTKRHAKRLAPKALAEFVSREFPLSQLPRIVQRQEGFAVPTFAVHGNHDDAHVVNAFRRGESRAVNLHVLDPREPRRVGNLLLFGLGGNVLVGRRLFDANDARFGVAGEGGKIWATLAEIGVLLRAAEKEQRRDEIRVLVTHVSPGKEPLIVELAARIGARMAVSGHMGSPLACVWNEFAVREQGEASEKINARILAIEGEYESVKQAGEFARFTDEVREAIEFAMRVFRSPRGEGFYRGSFFVNVPDAAVGHAVLVNEGGRIGLETCSRVGW